MSTRSENPTAAATASSRRILMRIAYDGSSHPGWQSQKTGDGIQDLIESAIEAVTGQPTRLSGAGRTDAGVHANGQTAHADVPRHKLTPAKAVDALNGNLPRSIRIRSARQVSPEFHARFSATGKTYRYRVWLDRWHHPLELGRSWHFPYPVDLSRLPDLVSVLHGTHDFAAFCANRGRPETTTSRTLYRIKTSRRGPLLEIRVTGSGFLYRMVRMLAGGIMDCLRVGRNPDRLIRQLHDPTLRLMREAAPAHGLYLDRVHYRPLTIASVPGRE